jgi:hypothetical protein
MGIVAVAAFAALAAGPPAATMTLAGPAHQVGRQRRQAIGTVVSPAIFDRHVLTVAKTGLPKALAKGLKLCRVFVRRRRAEESDRRHRLLRSCRERRCHRAAESYNEIAPLHICSHAAKSDTGKVTHS